MCKVYYIISIIVHWGFLYMSSSGVLINCKLFAALMIMLWAIYLHYLRPFMVQIMGCRRAGDNPIIWTIDGIVFTDAYIAKLGLDELGTVTEAIILATYTFQWLYRYCIRIYCILCFRNITLIVDLCAYFTLIIVLINFIFYLCVLKAFISYHCIFCVFIHLCIESRGLATFWC